MIIIIIMLMMKMMILFLSDYNGPVQWVQVETQWASGGDVSVLDHWAILHPLAKY